MFSPNCVVVVPSPEISIKSSHVRSFMLKKLAAVMEDCLLHESVSHEKFVTLSSTIMVKSSSPKEVLDSLRNCFGINYLAVAQEVSFSSLDELSSIAIDLSSASLTKGTFAVRV